MQRADVAQRVPDQLARRGDARSPCVASPCLMRALHRTCRALRRMLASSLADRSTISSLPSDSSAVRSVASSSDGGTSSRARATNIASPDIGALPTDDSSSSTLTPRSARMRDTSRTMPGRSLPVTMRAARACPRRRGAASGTTRDVTCRPARLELAQLRDQRVGLRVVDRDEHDAGELAAEPREPALFPVAAGRRDALRERFDESGAIGADRGQEQRGAHTSA